MVREDLLAGRAGVRVVCGGRNRDILIGEKTAAGLRRTKLKGVLLDRLALLPRHECGSFNLARYQQSDSR